MSVGMGLLHKIITSNLSWGYLSERGLIAESFIGKEKTVYVFIDGHVKAYGQLPSIETIERTTDIEFSDYPSEPVDFWIDGVVKRNIGNKLTTDSKRVQRLVSERKVEEAKNELRNLYLSVQMGDKQSRITDLLSLADSVVVEHDKRQHSGIMRGVPFGMAFLDSVSDGAQPSDTIAICGRPGQGKSFLLLRFALTAYNEGRTPLLVSMEMNALQCARRLVSMNAGVPANSVRFGRLSYWGRDKLVRNIGDLKEMKNGPFPIIQGSLKTTVEDLAVRIQEINPSVLYVDGAYLLRTKNRISSRWERVAETAEILKIYASHFEIPVISTYQFNRQGPGSLSNIGMSDTIGQLASIVLSLEDDPDYSGSEGEFSATNYKTLELLKGREGERGVLRLLYDMCKMRIEQESVLSDSGYERYND